MVFRRNEKTSVKQSMKRKVCSNLADLPPLVDASSCQEWQFHISTVRAHIGSTGRSSGR